MKKILMLTHEFPPFRGGIATYASRLAGAAHRLGHQVTVMAPDFGRQLIRSDREDHPFEVIRYHSGPYSYRKMLPLLWRSCNFSEYGSYDLVHAVDAAYILSLAFLNRFKSVPFAATVYGTEILSMPSSRQARFLGLEDMFHAPAQLFTISSFTQDLLIRHCPRVSPERVRVTPLGVDQNWFGPAELAPGVLCKLGIPESHRVILTVARLDERKGHRIMLEAVSRLDPEVKAELSYVIVGKKNNSAYEQELHRLAAACGAHVLFTDEVSDEMLHALYARACLFCMPGQPHPKKVEGFGLVYLEAAAQGLPSVATRTGGVPEVVIHGQTGLLTDPLDVTALTEALATLLTDEPLRKMTGERARRHAMAFTWERCAERTYGD